MTGVVVEKGPVREAERIYRIGTDLPRIGKRSEIPYPVYAALRDHSTKLASVFGEGSLDAAFTGEGLAERVRVNLVTPEYFSSLRVSAQLCRVFSPPGETGPVLSDGCR